jgi:vitamin B12 transporter
MRKRMPRAILGLLVLALVIGPAVAQAQEGGDLKGKVIDKSGKFPLPTVRVAVVGTRKSAPTNSEGEFIIQGIPAGVYKVTFELAGYMTETSTNVTITAGQTAELNAALSTGFAHEVTVTARREVETLQMVPQNIEVLTTLELTETPAANLGQALNNISGVDIETGSGNSAWGTFMYIDGYEDVYIRKMVDGVDVGEVVSNWSQINVFSQDLIEQVEVVKGGSSSVWGSNMGGIVNIVTKRPRGLERPQFTLRGAYSSFGKMTFGEDASAIGQSGNLQDYSAHLMGNYKKLGYTVGISHNNHDGFVEYGAEKNTSVFTKLGYDFNDKTYLDFLYNRTTLGYQNHAYLLVDFLPPDFPYYWNYKQDMDSTSQVASLKLSSYVLPSLNLEAQLKFHQFKYGGATEYLEGSLFQPPGGTIENSDFLDQKLGFTVKGSFNPNESFSLVSGVDYYRIKADFTSFIADQPVIYVDEVAPFINTEYRVGPLSLHSGARYDYNSSFGSQLSPSVGANLNFLKASLVRVNVARTFKVPDLWYTLGEAYFDLILPNPDLRPERAWAYSAGFESQELQYIWVKVSGYYHNMTNGIVTVPADIEGRLTWGNSTKFIRKGYEAEIGFLTPFGLSGYFGTNHNKHENSTEESVLTWIPTRTYKSGLKYKNEALDLLLSVRGRWIWWNEDEELMSLFFPKDKRWSFDIRVSKGFKVAASTHLSVFLDVFNIFDQIYWDRSDFPNPRRWAQLGLEVAFR